MGFDGYQRPSMTRINRSASLRMPQPQEEQQQAHAGDSPPRTPPSQVADSKSSKRGLHARPSLRETMLDDTAPGADQKDGNDSGDERDPHDLSLSPKHVTRTSIVDNMLLSLDQFALSGSSVLDDYRLFNSVFESDTYDNSQDSIMHGRFRGHTFSSSFSSEADFSYDESGGRYTTQVTRGCRSNSSSNYQSGPKGIASTRSREGTNSRGQTYEHRGSFGTGSRTNGARKGSKGSASSNMDLGYSFSSVRMGPGNERRSASFDYGSRQAFAPLSESTASDGILAHDEIDAAPTPSVPAGPRKYHPQIDLSSGTLNHSSSRTPALSRRNSAKSARPSQVTKGRPENVGTGTVRSRDGDFMALGEAGLEPPPTLLTAMDPSAPSPTISFNKPFIPPVEPTPTKERPGFFRRVFGSSKNSSPAPSDHIQAEVSYSPENDGRDGNTLGPNLKSWKQPLKSYAAASNPAVPSHVVNKKPSFFRRRKKSVVDSVPPPIILPQELGPRTIEMMKPEPSPVSSLRQVMNPFLADASSAFYDSKEYPNWEADAHGGENRVLGSLASQKPNLTPGATSSSSSRSRTQEQNKESISAAMSSQGRDDSFSVEGNGNEDPFSKPTNADASLFNDKARHGVIKTVEVGQAALAQSKDDLQKVDPSGTQSSLVGSLSQTDTISSEAPRDRPPLTKRQSGEGAGMHGAFSSKEHLDESARVSTSEISNYYTASNTPVIASEDPKLAESAEGASDDEPSEMDREQAQKLYDSQDEVVGNEPAAAWLGDPDRAMVRKAYMELFDWSNMNILAALRSLCNRLVLKGETQQVDRVLDAFSSRWCECNPRHGFKASDVVHTICYSILLLNTDLHLADIDQKMTKNQFVRNTMPTIHRVAIDAAPDGFEPFRGSNRLKYQPSIPDSNRSQSISQDAAGRSSVDNENVISMATKRLSRTDFTSRTTVDSEGDGGPLVNAPFNTTMRAWEAQVENVLKDFYSSIQKQRLPLHGAPSEQEANGAGGGGSRLSTNNLLGPTGNVLRRSPSTLSKSGSDIYPRGRSADSRYGTARWSSKPRSRARLYPPSNMGSSRTSLDDQSSLWSPSASSTWSKYSLSKLTSVSVDSFSSDYPRGDYQQSIGFANALSHAIIREDSAYSITSFEDVDRTTPLLEDETLELAGAPWAKEGSLKHKHHLDSVDKRAKDRNWSECFAVIQQGWMRLFSFSASTRSVRQKAKQRQNGGVVVGGGNWTENAEEIWKFLLRQTIASALPPPGYSKSRPHVWALSLPTGAVHLFQVGTPEIVREFVSTANYWSARLSKEPLVGGISNIEYGWSDAVINSALMHADSKTPPSSSGARHSIQSSIRSSIDQQGVRPRLPADRVHISDWAPPQQSMMASALPEAEQLTALQNYVKNVEDDLQKHNELRQAMILAFSPRHPNGAKALANWERKSSYLLREIVKFRTYIDSLHAARSQKEKIYASRDDSNTVDEDAQERHGVTTDSQHSAGISAA